MPHDTISATRALISELDALADRVQAVFDDASAAAYARPAANALDHLDALYHAAEAAHAATRQLRAAVDA